MLRDSSVSISTPSSPTSATRNALRLFLWEADFSLKKFHLALREKRPFPIILGPMDFLRALDAHDSLLRFEPDLVLVRMIHSMAFGYELLPEDEASRVEVSLYRNTHELVISHQDQIGWSPKEELESEKYASGHLRRLHWRFLGWYSMIFATLPFFGGKPLRDHRMPELTAQNDLKQHHAPCLYSVACSKVMELGKVPQVKVYEGGKRLEILEDSGSVTAELVPPAPYYKVATEHVN